MIAKITAFIAALIAALGLLQAPPPEVWEPDSKDVTALAQCLYGECRGCSELQQQAVCWCIFNRVDSDQFPDTVYGVISQRGQFFGFSPTNPVWENLYNLAYREIKAWHDGEPGVFGKEYLYFAGNGRINIFTTQYGGGERWAEE